MEGFQEITIDYLFDLAMKRKWDEVAKVYKRHPWAHTAKLTNSEETALHIAVSSYDSEAKSCHENCIKEMISSFPQNDLIKILSMHNNKGNAPLHLAAAVGWVAICHCLASKNIDLISLRNSGGETPLFVAAYHGKLEAFLCLHEIYTKDGESDDSLCRRDDGNTILHSSISGEYFGLAYQIISYYPKLVNSVNEEGESPLHVLAKKPNVFKSNSNFGVYDSIIYHCVSVEELQKKKYVPKTSQNNGYGHSRTRDSGINYPDNYRTCVDIIQLLWTPIRRSLPAGLYSYTTNPNDEESQNSQGFTANGVCYLINGNNCQNTC